MEFYWARIRCTVNGEYSGGTTIKILTDTMPMDQKFQYGWDNIEEYLKAHCTVLGSLHVYAVHTKKGWKCDPHTDCFFNKTYKQWKKDPLDIQVTVTFEPAKLSLNQILNWYDSDEAIQYLLERGMNCITK